MHRLTHLSLRHPGATLLVLGLITLALAAGLPRVRTEYGFRVLIGEDHPAIRNLEHFIDRYAGGLPLWVAWACGEGRPCRTVFDPVSLEMASDMTQELQALAEVRAVRGPANTAVLVPTAEGFDVRQLVEDGKTVADVDSLAAYAVEDPFWRGKLVSRGGDVAALVVQATGNEPETDRRILAAVEDAIAPYERAGFEFFLSGDIPSTVVAGEELAQSSNRLIPLTVLVIGLVLLTLSRSLLASAAALATMGIAVVWTVGVLGWLGWPRDGILEVLTPVILVVGVCDGIHLLERHAVEQRAIPTAGPGDPIVRAAERVGPACLLTTATTAAAFGSFVTSDLDTFVRFGAISAWGVTACLILTFSLLPILARSMDRPASRTQSTANRWDWGLAGVARVARRRWLGILVIASVVIGICAQGWIARLRVDNFWLESFGEDSRVVRWIRFLDARLGATSTLEIEVTLPPGTPLEQPETLLRIRRFSRAVESLPGFRDATSVVDLLARSNELIRGGQAVMQPLGPTTAANAELLELIAMQDADLLQSWITLDRSSFRISVDADYRSSVERSGVMREVRRLAAEILPATWKTRFGGEFAMGIEWVHDVQTTQLRSFPTAFALVFLMLALFLRSFWLAVAGMVPTLLAVVATLGTMGWLGMSLDVGRAMIAAVVIGIAVDDAIHLLYAYRQRRRAGWAPGAAMEDALLRVGRAVVTTSLALALGFLTLMASAWQTIASFGFLVALAILGALAASLFVLPALVFAFAGTDSESPGEAG